MSGILTIKQTNFCVIPNCKLLQKVMSQFGFRFPKLDSNIAGRRLLAKIYILLAIFHNHFPHTRIHNRQTKLYTTTCNKSHILIFLSRDQTFVHIHLKWIVFWHVKSFSHLQPIYIQEDRNKTSTIITMRKKFADFYSNITIDQRCLYNYKKSLS